MTAPQPWYRTRPPATACPPSRFNAARPRLRQSAIHMTRRRACLVNASRRRRQAAEHVSLRRPVAGCSSTCPQRHRDSAEVFCDGAEVWSRTVTGRQSLILLAFSSLIVLRIPPSFFGAHTREANERSFLACRIANLTGYTGQTRDGVSCDYRDGLALYRFDFQSSPGPDVVA